MTQSHRPRGAGRTTSVLSAVGFCLGIPALLCRAAGWPLPRRLPSLSAVGNAFSGGWRPDDQFVMSVLAIIAWIVWAQIGMVVIVELRAIRSGQRIQSLPFSAWCRPIAIRLAATLALLTPFAPRAAGAAPVPRPAVVTVTVPAVAQAEATPAMPMAALDPTPVSTTYVVRVGDTLWDLAETHLGDPLRYREIFELNRGRVQHDGRQLEDSEFLRPGWRLDLPVPPPAIPAASVPSVPPVEGGASQDTSLQAACTSAASEQASAATDPVIPRSADPEPQSPAAPAPGPPPPSSNSPAPTSNRTEPLTVAQIGLPSMTAGVLLGYLGRLRRDRERRRRFRHRFPSSTPQESAAERRVRAVARTEAPAWVDLALRHLASSLQEDGAPPPPAVLAVRAGDLGVEVLVSPPWPVAPGRFLPVDDGHTWRLDPAVELAELATITKDCPAYLPALVTVGDTDSGAVLVDLDEAGTLTVEGHGEQVTGVLTAMAAELAAAPWSESCDVVLIGLDETLAGLERVRTVSPADAVAQLMPLAGNPGVNGLADGAQADIPAGPTIAIVGPGSLEADDLRTLLDTAKPHSGLCVIAAARAGAPGRNRLVGCPDGTGVLYPLGLSVILARLSATAADLVALVTTTAARDTDHPTTTAQVDSSDASPTESAVPAADSEAPADPQLPADEPAEGEEDPVEPTPERVVEVRLLGPVEITWQHHTPKRQVAELISYLAVHPKGVTPDQARLALWPATVDDERFGERAPATYHALTTKARAALGQDRAGQSLILREVNNSLRLSPSVGCDWLDFEQHVRAARRDPKSAIGHLRAALSLVRGRPFEGWSFAWIEVERLDGAMEAAISDAAQELAALALEDGDIDTARFAVEQGLRAVPSAEALLRSAMRVAAAVGDRAALERAWRDAQRVAAGLDALAEPEPETAELYESLRRSMSGAE